jgi:hypothetical protein
MSASSLKGALLEYIVRRLLINCGFTRVIPDGLMIFSRGRLTMINGKGAAHDADVLMNPPIQIPFSYPSRINFECKAYNRPIGLTIIRNALGLRYDLNEFEIVTRHHLKERQKNRRSRLAIDNRQRYNYQVGVASVENFTKPAFEFAANNKIPLISLRWFLPKNICDSFHLITDAYLGRFVKQELDELYDFLKSSSQEENFSHDRVQQSIFGEILNAVSDYENRISVGLLESGDFLFLIAQNRRLKDYLSNTNRAFHAQFHYLNRDLDYWTLTIDEEVEAGFYLPKNIISMWKDQNFSAQAAINIKQKLFAKMFVFVNTGEFPFRMLHIDKEWLQSISE